MRRGFTLLELLAVIAIIAVLTGIVIGVGRRATETGRTARAKAELAALSAALESYKRQHGDYPRVTVDASPSDFASGRQLYGALNGQRGPALNAASFPSDKRQRVLIEKARFELAEPAAADDAANHLLDPWGNPYHYAYKADSGWKNPSFVLWSIGPDGKDSAALAPGGYPDLAVPENTDNIYANRN